MKFEIVITGRGGHGSRPDKGINPVDCFCVLFGALQGIGCQVQEVDGGNAATIIPEKLRFLCTCSDGAALRTLVEHTCAAFQCGAVITEK